MCGIVLAGCAKTLAQTEVALFEKLVYHDTIRGSHSTGVFAGYKFETGNKEQYVIYGKTAQTGPDFLESKTWKSVKTQDYASATNTVLKRSPYFLVGHNRYATMGAKTSQNAHPFVSGDVTLVHNGTLTNQSLLPDHTKFEVDSANICHAINKQGIEETLKQLDGAFTLVWYDDRDKTLNIIRNEERPFHLARTELDTWYGASEEEMLMWLLKREDKYSLYRSSPKIEEHFECEVGVQYVFDVSDGNFDLVERIKHELPKFEPKYLGGYGSFYDDDYSYTSYYGKSTSPHSRNEGNNYAGKGVSGNAAAKTSVTRTTIEDAKEALFKEAGLEEYQIGDSIWFLSTGFETYPSRSGRGRMDGFIDKHDKDVKIMCHGMYKDDYEEQAYYYGEIISIYKVNDVVNLIVKDATYTPDQYEDAVVTADHKVYNKAEWESKGTNLCLDCLTKIPFDEAEDAVPWKGSYICRQCNEEIKMADVDSGFVEEAEEEDAPFRDETFHCMQCGELCNFEEESSLSFGICNTCYYSTYEHTVPQNNVVAITKELDNGEVVTESQWNKINTCTSCKTKVSFKDAEYCLIENNDLICLNCYL